ncbi:prephenate dehydrogenase/arogenate dehydrogenase family protein [Vibrio sp. Of7-15]|uniref:prephenate dehydrogenase dimerization domain-containing protein n=1 Tax=Vibrio sp. Of7-15 TaxID=2724879 RepID=UPI001EF1F06D|nr:prephenate dehydrogenase dimerization domain-containing protein [Vibrio sp. Of7-15]MCG7498970.1 prephenate dehydrogenase/arogenate dehydrogenase family protein [Vibrio sp. Of7-15]
MSNILKSSGYLVTIVDLAPPVTDELYVQCDVRQLDQSLADRMKNASMVVFALPESIADDALITYMPILETADSIVHTCSVQKPFHKLASDCLPMKDIVGVNPMFSPQLAYEGRTVLLCEPRTSKTGAILEAILLKHNMEVTRLDPEAHDNMMGLCQALPHAAILSFLSVLTEKNHPIDLLYKIAPPPMKTLLSLAARILTNEVETYWDIQAYNDEAKHQRERLMSTLAQLNTEVEKDGFHSFSARLQNSAKQFGDVLSVSANDAELIFNTLNSHQTGGKNE